MKIADKLAVPAIMIAGGIVYLAEEYNLPYLIPLAMGIFGLFAILLGIETFIHGRIDMFNRRQSRREEYSGLPSRLLGLIVFLFGAGLIFYAVSEWMFPGRAGGFLANFALSMQGLGVFLAVIGFFTLLFGLIRLIAGSAHRPEERRAAVDFGYRARGLVNLVVGIILLTGGVWLIFK